MEPQSVMVTPTAREARRLTAAEITRRRKGSVRPSRRVPTTSYPASISAKSRGISSGGFCRSASSVTTTSPRAYAKPASTAACCPALRASATTFTAGCDAWMFSNSSSERSVLPSSTYTTSTERSSCWRTRWSRVCRRGMLADSLKTGITTETAGSVPTASARGGCAPVGSGCMAEQNLLERTRHVPHIITRHGGEQREGKDALGGARRVRQGIGQQGEPLAVEAMEVEGLEVQSDPDVRGEESVHHRVPPDPERFELETDHEQVPGVSRRVGHGRQHLDRRDPCQGFAIPARDARASLDELLQTRELSQPKRRLQIRHVVLEAEGDDRVRGGPAPPVSAPGVASNPVEPQQPHALAQVGIVGGDHAPFAGRDGLDRMEAEDRCRAPAADRVAAVLAAERVGRVLDQREPVTGGDRPEAVEVDGLPAEMHRQDRAGARRDRGGDGLRVDVERPGIDVDEDRAGPDGEDHVAGRRPRHGGGDDLVAGPNACCQEREVKAGRGGAHRDGVRGANGVREGLLEGRHARTARQPPRAEAGGHRFDFLRPDRRAGQWEKVGAHTSPFPDTSSTRRGWPCQVPPTR